MLNGAAVGHRAGRQRFRPTRLQVALAVSLVLHAGLLTFRFIDPERFERVFRNTPLDVVLVNARTAEAPVKPQAIAQARLDGGGDAAAGRATSPLPPAPTQEMGDAAQDTRRHVEELREVQQQMLAVLRNELALLPPPDPKRDDGSPQDREQEEHRRQLLKQLAEIEKRINEDNAQPRKVRIGPATTEKSYALYYDGLRRRIEERGTRDFPQHLGQKLYGELTMEITIDATGRVVDIIVLKASGSKVLDLRAAAIVRASAPFGRFTAAMRGDADQIVTTWNFRFTREDGLETTLSAGTR